MLFLSLFLFSLSIAGLKNRTKAANNTASHIINHMFTLYKCGSMNIKVGMAMKLRQRCRWWCISFIQKIPKVIFNKHSVYSLNLLNITLGISYTPWVGWYNLYLRMQHIHTYTYIYMYIIILSSVFNIHIMCLEDVLSLL